MPEVAKTIRQWLGGRTGDGDAFEQEAARTQLRDHIEPQLLEAFLKRAVDDEQHQTVIDHLNQCGQCREAIAVVLLAVDNPKAAAELALESKRRLQEEPEVWWKQALRWSALTILALLLIVAAVLVPKSKDPNSPVSRWFEEADNSVGRLFESEADSSSSSTSFGDVVSSTFEKPKPEPAKRSSGRVFRQPGWDTGPAAYAGRVEPSPPLKEVDISGGQPEPRTGEPSASHASAQSGAAGSSSTQHATRRLVVGPAGELRRTLDGGATWQNVIVGPNLVFRSLALSGRTVWATGDAGALYRSFDAAEHWQQVLIHYRGEPIKDDLVAIEFADPQHGYLRGADGREWITVDGGNKWVLNTFTARAR